MATTLNWPSVLAEVLVSGAPIREKGLVGWWSMNRTALDGSVLRDDSGSGNDGTIYGATPVDGVSGKGLSFDGVNDYATLPVGAYFGIGKIVAVSAWAKPLDASASQFLAYPDGTNSNRFYLQIASASTIYAVANTGTLIAIPLATNERAHLVFIRDNIAGTMTVYKNGAFVGTQSTTLPTAAASLPLYLGDLNGTSAFANCELDELRIYNRATTAEEVAALYARVTSYQALPEFPMPDGFSETVQDGALRSRSDSGLEKIRRRFTATPTLYSTRYQLTAEQKQLLDYFYRTTTRGGTLRFNWTHPHGYSVEARFRAPPVYTATDVEVIADVRLEVAA